MAPKEAAVSFTSDPIRINPNDWTALSYDLYQSINASLGERGALEQNLKDWLDLYEMEVGTLNSPWENASNLFIPLIPAQLNAALSYITGKVFVPRFYIVSGNTADSATDAHQVERYYNAELTRQRGQTTWFDQHITWVHESLRDGTSIMEILWRRTVKKRKVVTFDPKVSSKGVPVLKPDGTPQHERKVHEVDVIEYDDVELKPVLLRDFLLIPAEAFSVEDAVGVARCCWLYEAELREMIEDGVLSEEEVERALDYVPLGSTSDIASDRQSPYDKTIGDQINPGLAQGEQTSRFFANRGPIKVWRIHTRQYDMNRDGLPEENIFWLHELSQRMLGWTPYEYIAPGRPFFAFSPDPRPDRFYGYSLVERLASSQAEVNAMFNQRNNLLDLMMNPPLLYQKGEELDDVNQKWGPGVRWAVSQKDAVSFLQFPQLPLTSFQNEALLTSYVDKLTGVSAPALGAQSSGRRSATESKIQAAATTTRNDLVALRLRVVCRAILNFIHILKLQYVSDDPSFSDQGQKLTLPREVLGKDYQLDIAGSADPLDASTRRQEMLGAFQQLMQVPWIGQDREKSFALVRKMADTYNWPDAIDIIGTAEEAKQEKQQMAKQAQDDKQFQKQLEVAKVTKGQGGSPHQQGNQRPPPKAQMQR
jgi:hypothetical protein